MTNTHTDSVEATIDMKKYYEYWGLHIGPKSSQHMQERVLYKIAMMIKAELQATRQQQVEEARETGYREGFAKASELAHEAHQKQVEEAVSAERSRIYGRLAQMKSVYVTIDTGSALVALMGEDIIREEAPNHQD